MAKKISKKKKKKKTEDWRRFQESFCFRTVFFSSIDLFCPLIFTTLVCVFVVRRLFVFAFVFVRSCFWIYLFIYCLCGILVICLQSVRGVCCELFFVFFLFLPVDKN